MQAGVSPARYAGPVTSEKQRLKLESLPPSVGFASGPQKVSRVLTGFESLLLAAMVRAVVLQPLPAFVVSLKYDG